MTSDEVTHDLKTRFLEGADDEGEEEMDGLDTASRLAACCCWGWE